jgi:hypothetical protein
MKMNERHHCAKLAAPIDADVPPAWAATTGGR